MIATQMRTLRTEVVATILHKHRCCSCAKWTVFVYSLILDYLTGLDARAVFFTTLQVFSSSSDQKKQRVGFGKFFMW